MDIPADVILLWPGTNEAIPSNWSRETQLDGKYPKSWGIEAPATPGGAATHAHTSPPHTHAIGPHSHTGTVPAPANRNTANNQNSGDLALIQHTHTFTTGAVTSSSNFGSTAATYGAVSNDPPYHALIFIKASPGAIINNDIIALWSGWNGQNTVPQNWQFCNGDSGSPDLRNKYIKGAEEDADAGTTGGSYTNVHDLTHAHTEASHAHSGYTTSNSTDFHFSGQDSCCSVRRHSHSYSAVNSESVTPNEYTGSLTTTETVEPAYIKVAAIQKKSNGIKARGLIGLWLGDLDDIPAGWYLCDGENDTPDLQDKFIKIANTTSEIGDTGGSNTHAHAAQPHDHTAPPHRHYQPQTKDHQSLSLQAVASGAGNYDDTIATDVHGAHYTDYASPNTTSTNTTANESNNEPEYLTAAYIQFRIPFSSGAGIFADL